MSDNNYQFSIEAQEDSQGHGLYLHINKMYDEETCEYLRQRGYSFGIIDLEFLATLKMPEYIVKYGTSGLMGLTYGTEAIFSRSFQVTSRPEESIAKMIEALEPKEKLTIIDPYIFRPKGNKEPSVDELSDYIALLKTVLEPALKNVKKVKVLTHSPNESVKNEFENLVLSFPHTDAGALDVILDEKSHDRFIVIDGKRALCLGTSMNGMDKVFRVDYAQEDEVQALIDIFGSDL